MLRRKKYATRWMSNLSRKLKTKSSFERVTLSLGLMIALATFAVTIAALIAGVVLYYSNVSNMKKEAEIILNKMKEYEKKITEHFDGIDENIKPIILKTLSDSVTTIADNKYEEQINAIAKNKISNKIRRADAILELDKRNYESSLFLWKKILEYEPRATDAIYYCSLLHLLITEEEKNIDRLLESKKYLKNISQESIQSVFSFLNLLQSRIYIKSLNYDEKSKLYKYIEWVYTKIENTQQSFELYLQWGNLLNRIYTQPLMHDPNLITRSLEKFSDGEKFLETDMTITQKSKIDFYISYSNAIKSKIFIGSENAAEDWAKARNMLQSIKDSSPVAKFYYALLLRDENFFYNRISAIDFKECLTILEELKETTMRSDAMDALGRLYYDLYKDSDDINFLVKSSEYMRATISLPNPDINKCISLLDTLYILASKSDDRKKYIAQAKHFFHELYLIGYMLPEIFEYDIKFLILAGAHEKDILAAFSNYKGAIPQSMLTEKDIKVLIDKAYNIAH